MLSWGRDAADRRFPRWALLAAATVAFFAVVVSEKVEAERLAGVLRQADWRWLPLAPLCEVLFQGNEAAFYWLMIRLLGYRARLVRVLQLTLAASFVNRVAPSGGVTGAALLAERMSRVGVPPGVTVAANAARTLLDYGAFVVVLGSGLLYLSRHHELTGAEVRAAETFGGLLLGAALLLVALGLNRRRLARLLVGVSGLLNAAARLLLHRPLVPQAVVARHAEEVLGALSLLSRARREAVLLVLMGFLIHLFDLAGLLAAFVAVGYPPHLGVLVAGYGLAYLAGFVSLIPSGLGVFEASMTTAYASLGVPLEVALLVTLLYRLTSLWLPLLAGYLSLQSVLARPDEAPQAR